MTSAVDIAVPISGAPTTASVRENFATIREEISALQDAATPAAILVSSSYALKASERFVAVDATGGNVTITLMASTPGRVVTIVRLDGSANTVVIAPGASPLEGTSPVPPACVPLYLSHKGSTVQLLQGSDSTFRVVEAQGVYAVDFYDFAASGATWTKALWGKEFTFIVQGAGSGGGSGRKGAAGTARSGGGGGSSGRRTTITYNATDLSAVASAVITIGAGGAGGVAQTTNSTDGNIGTIGGTTTITGIIASLSGNPGNPGTATTVAGGSATISTIEIATSSVGNGGGSSATAAGASGGGGVTYLCGGGGGGGGITTGNVLLAGGTGGAGCGAITFDAADVQAGTAGGTTAAGGAGETLPTYRVSTRAGLMYAGAGGGGGAPAQTGGAFAGGAGGVGAGGGGGGAGEDGASNSGAGGAGGDGFAAIITWA